ncbi:trace amine-associated receptor 13c-like [Aulostomus maculatus]
METQEGAELCYPQLINISCRKPTLHWSEGVLLNTLLAFISLLTVALDLLVMISVSHFRQLHTPTNILLLSLAVADFLVGLLLMPGEIFLNTACWSLGDFMCSLYNYIFITIVSSSVGHMVLISVDRYVAICHPLHYTARVTVRRAQVCVCLCWLCSVLYCGIIASNDLSHPGKYSSCYGECLFVIGVVAQFIDLVVTFILPLTLIITLYMRVFMVAVSQARAMRSHTAAVKLNVSVTVTTRKSELKAARTLGVLVVVFLMCFCPFYCASLAGDELLNSASVTYMIYLVNFNSCLNPIIYALFYPWFRKSAKLIVTLQILQPGSCQAKVL